MGHVFTDEQRDKSHEAQRRKRHQNFLDNPDRVWASEVIRFNLIYSGREEKCEECNLVEWNGKPITLDIDHIDGRRNNNRLTNLRFLCPNCHSQTETFRGRNINKGRKKVSDEDLKKALENTSSIREALIKVGLAAKGGNYSRAKRILGALNG